MAASPTRARLRLGLLAVAIAIAGGCINLPPALERELECPVAGEPDNFGAHHSCHSAEPRSSR
jgi:hypothetical protein